MTKSVLSGLRTGYLTMPRRLALRAESVLRVSSWMATSPVAEIATRWIMDGNYSRVMDRIWTRATSLVWLDFPLALVLARGLRRSLRRSLRRESLYSENRETMRRTFFSHDSLLLWIMTSRGPRRRRYQQVLEEGRFPQLEVHRLTSPGKAAQWLEGLGTASNECSLR